MRVAALEDDALQRELIVGTVRAIGHTCHGYSDGRALIQALRVETFDLIIIDWVLPDISGLDVVRWVRANCRIQTAILMVTSRTSEDDIVESLNAGADDYLIKPWRQRELIARIQALLRRTFPDMTMGGLRFGPYLFNTANRTVRIGRDIVDLKPREFDLALFLFRNCDRMLSRAHLLEAVWGLQSTINSRSLDTHVSRLRAKLAIGPDNGYRLFAVYGQGYRLEHLTEDAVEGDDGAARESDSAA